MTRYVAPSCLDGRLHAPTSKSHLQRALAAATLASGTSILEQCTLCDDALAAVTVARALGAAVAVDGTTVRIEGGFRPSGEPLDCGESGLCIRMFTPIAALHDRPLTLIGHGPLCRRPVDLVEGPLRQLGVEVQTCDGRLPIRVQGPLRGGEAEVDGSVSSQFLTGLLIALAAAPRDSILRVRDLKSRPYIDLTLAVLRQFGVGIENHNYQAFRVKGGQHFQSGTHRMEGDWSGAAFLLVAGALAGDIRIAGLDAQSTQADRAMLVALERAGASCAWDRGEMVIRRSALRGFEFDATECPDLFPPLVALAAGAAGQSRIHGASRLVHKESNRAVALCEEFDHLGIRVEPEGDALQVWGGTPQAGSTSARGDHRIAMAVAVAALAGAGEVAIHGAEVVAKSYPGFFDDLARLGAGVR